MPDFSVGRVGWDNWLIYSARRRNFLVIDATSVASVLHQNHHKAHLKLPNNRLSVRRNLNIIGGKRFLFKLTDATHVMDREGIHKKDFSLLDILSKARTTPEVLHGFTPVAGLLGSIYPLAVYLDQLKQKITRNLAL